jgi:hypothetical protein
VWVAIASEFAATDEEWKASLLTIILLSLSIIKLQAISKAFLTGEILSSIR